LSKEGESGRRKISQYTRYLTVALALLQGSGMCLMLRQQHIVTVGGLELIPMVLTLTAGTAFLMWLGEQITDKGIGNGVSLIIFAGIMARMPFDVGRTVTLVRGGSLGYANVFLLVAIFVGTIVAIVYMQQGQRKIPVQHAKRVVGTRVYGGGSTFLPLRVNQAGVIPIIFAISIVYFPATIARFVPHLKDSTRDFFLNMFDPSNVLGALIYFALVIFFTYFYTAVTFNVPEVADNLKKNGGFIPGIRPGKPTAQYLDRVLTRITLAGAIFLGLIALLQYYVPKITQVTTFTLVGGTSLLIVVGVAMELMQQIEAHLVMRHYEGFIK
jgi:preprotein translocase subunit SecY